MKPNIQMSCMVCNFGHICSQELLPLGLSLGKHVNYAGNHRGMPCTTGQSRQKTVCCRASSTYLLLLEAAPSSVINEAPAPGQGGQPLICIVRSQQQAVL